MAQTLRISCQDRGGTQVSSCPKSFGPEQTTNRFDETVLELLPGNSGTAHRVDEIVPGLLPGNFVVGPAFEPSEGWNWRVYSRSVNALAMVAGSA